MIKFAVIGTNWISEKFVDAAVSTGLFQLNAVYSRNIQTAQSFCQKNNPQHFFDDLNALAACPDIHAVYIASPNSLHCQQACLMMKHGKHVICEKPLSSHLTEAQTMYKEAHANKVVLFEAFKTAYLPHFIQLKKDITKLGKLHKVHLTYCQYSSRYPLYLNGENPNTFNPEFSNGSIMDIGYYCIGAAVSLFGEPLSIQATAHLLETGVDAHGFVILRYPQIDVTVSHSKVCNSYVANEILGEEGAILIHHLSECQGYQIQYRTNKCQEVALTQEENSMCYEAIAFADQIKQGFISPESQERSLIIASVLTEIRKQTGVVFPADKTDITH